MELGLKLRSITIWMPNTMVKLLLDQLVKPSMLYLIPVPQTSGFPQRNVGYQLLVISIRLLISLNLVLIRKMELISKSNMDQDQLRDTGVLMMLTLEV